MKKRTPVSSIMTDNPVSVNLSDRVHEVAQLFAQHHFRHVPVVSGKSLIGMISKSDIERISFVTGYTDPKASTQIYDALTIDQIMSKNLDTIDEKDEIRAAAKLLAKGDYHALPVLSGGELKGIITSTDIINHLLEQY